MADAAISLMLLLIVINTIHVYMFTDINHGKGQQVHEAAPDTICKSAV